MELKDVLKHDPLDHIERVTGKRMGEDDVADMLAFQHVAQHAEVKHKMLTEAGDTLFSNTLERYEGIITNFGFEKVLELPFQSRWHDLGETFYVYAKIDEGLILYFDTFTLNDAEAVVRVNGGSVLYNWIPNDRKDMWSYISSGGLHGTGSDDGVWSGSHDCREALIYNLTNLRENGKFVSPWKFMPFLYMLHHGDKNDDKHYSTINGERLAMLPKDVRACMGLEW